MSNASDFGAFLGALSSDTVRLMPGTCIWDPRDNGKWVVTRGGVEVPAVWLESASPRTGPVLLAVHTPPGSQSTTYVLGATFDEPFRKRDVGTVMKTAYGGYTDVLLDDGTQYLAARLMAHYASPAVNDRVMLMWRGGEAYIVGRLINDHTEPRIGPSVPLPDLPRRVDNGSSQFVPYTTRLFDPGADLWIAAQSRDLRLSPSVAVAWGYGGDTASLADKLNLLDCTIILGPRKPTPGGNAPIVLNFYRNDGMFMTGSQPPSTVAGPWTVTIGADFSGGVVTLPVEIAESLREGGSISMTVSAPVTFIDAPGAGFLKVNWSNT